MNALPSLTPRAGADRPTPPTALARMLTSGWAAACLLLAFWVLMVASLRTKSITSDEIAHATAGTAYWKFNDYRLNPENGNLPQRVAGLALAGGDFAFPARDTHAWRLSDEWEVGYDWFYHCGNDADRMLLRGRAACGLLAVALGALVWWCSRQLWGPAGGMLSLGLYVLCPTVLANGTLITSDLACALFFLAATVAYAALLRRVSPARVLLSGLTLGGLFLSKMSAPLILPIAAILLVARLLRRAPLPVALGAWRRTLERRAAQAAVFAGAGVVQVGLVLLVIWAGYGFRWTAFADADPARDRFAYSWEYLTYQPGPNQVLSALHFNREQLPRVTETLARHGVYTNEWSNDALFALGELRAEVFTPEQRQTYDRITSAPPPSRTARLLLALDRSHVLPQAYVYGYAYAWSFSQFRTGFLNGDFNFYGWKTFFPYTFFVKTPLATFGLLALAVLAIALRRRDPAGVTDGRVTSLAPDAGAAADLAYTALPYLALLGVYWAAVIPSHVDIGHRHILATYPPLFILGGAAATWGRGHRGRAALVAALLLLLAGDVLGRYPNYLAYFNPLAGGPAQGYRHLVDSSLDWGQDLRAAAPRIEQAAQEGPVYLSYFGNGSPKHYGIRARLLHSVPGRDALEEPVVKTLELPTATARLQLAEELRRRPDYDPDLVGMSAQGDLTRAVLVKRAAALRLTGGTYFISATLLQPVLPRADGPFGPWNARYETTYRQLAESVRPLLSDSLGARRAALAQRAPGDWLALWNNYDEYRFARLTAYLRQREPDGDVNFSILVYRLTDEQVARALDGPPPELGRDVPAELEKKYGPAPK